MSAGVDITTIFKEKVGNTMQVFLERHKRYVTGVSIIVTWQHSEENQLRLSRPQAKQRHGLEWHSVQHLETGKVVKTIGLERAHCSSICDGE